MSAGAHSDRDPVTPARRLEIASVHPMTSDRLGWSGVRAEHLVDPPDAEVDVPPTTYHWLIINHGPADAFSLKFGGAERTERTRSAPPESMILIPSGYDSKWSWRGAGGSTHILVDPLLIERVAAEALDLNPDRVEFPPTHDLIHPQIRSGATALGDELRMGGPGGRVLAEALGNVLAVHLLRKFAAPVQTDTSPGGTLPGNKLRAVTDYIHEHLDAELSLNHLAAVAHMSPYHFARLFKNSTGLPPHQYVITQRVERAKQLLRGSTRPTLAEVAADVGFADQSHFTRHFRRLVGITPRQFQ
jgi:AraC family transcriptional regulator